MKKTLQLAGLVLLTLHAAAQPKISSSTIGALEARNIGSATMSGRITAIDVEPKNTRVIYIGTAGGGIWKSTNAGSTFKPIFDKYCQSIGCMAIDQKNPETIWAGTGESNMRNSVSVGNGIYKSTDGGSSWKLMGLDSTEHISKLAIDPTNSDIIYAAAPGPLWGDSKNRGLYKSTDGGATWQKILYVNEKTGCSDVIIDPKNPSVIYASTWQFRRYPWAFSSGGPGSSLQKSTDGGKTWKKIQNGFEAGELGRICLAISPSEPNKLYAIAESKNTALYSTSDGGENWVKKSGSQNVSWRPFYFSVIVVDPTDSKRIYRPSLELSISSDGGESFKEASFEGGWVHSDHHALWINPSNSNHLILGTDGGVYQSLDRGNSWTMFANLPVSQFYHVAVDNLEPYNVYGGLQDNGSWYAPTESTGGIENKDWVSCGFGDGFWVQPDRSNPDIVYSESQGGNVIRFNKKTNESKDIKPYEMAGEPKLRYNWNTPVVTSPTNPKTLYVGAQYLYRSYNMGDTWERISGDLTTNDKNKQQQEKSGGISTDNSGAENHCTIFTIAESPLDEKMIWVGTDDGNIQLSTDGGKTWTNLAANFAGTGKPANAWVSSIEPSPYDKNVVFITFDQHAMGDMKTYVCKSTDMGKTWKSIATSDLKGFAHRIKQDPAREDMLYLGTESGLFMSFDGGASWIQYKSGDFPPVAVRDIAVQGKQNDLVLATHGRGIWILDDLSPIRSLNSKVMESEMAFLPGATSYITNGRYGSSYPGSGYIAPNSREGQVIYYYFKDRVASGEVRVDILDASGKLVNTIPGNKRKGVNFVEWNMRYAKGPRVARAVKADGSGFYGMLVPEGTYTARLWKGDKHIDQTIVAHFDPAMGHSAADIALREKTTKQLFDMQEQLAYQVARIAGVQDSLNARSSKNASLKKSNDALVAKLKTIREKCAASISGTAITGEEKMREKIGMLYIQTVSFDGKPTDSQIERANGLQKELESVRKEIDALIDGDLVKANAAIKKAGLAEVKPISWEEWDKNTKN